MRHYKVVDQWYKRITDLFTEMPEQERKDLALIIYDEIDYITLMGNLRPRGLFEKMGIECPTHQPVGNLNFDFTKLHDNL